MAAYCQVNGVIHFTSSAGWLPVHRDQLRAQRSVTSMGKLYLLPITFIKVIHSCFSKSWRPLYFLHIFISYFLEAGFLTIVYQHSETFTLCCCRFHKCCCASFLKMPTKRSEQQKWVKTPHLSATCLLFMEASMSRAAWCFNTFSCTNGLYSIGVSPIRCQIVKWSQRGTKDYLILVYYRHMLFLSLKRQFWLCDLVWLVC